MLINVIGSGSVEQKTITWLPEDGILKNLYSYCCRARSESVAKEHVLVYRYAPGFSSCTFGK